MQYTDHFFYSIHPLHKKSTCLLSCKLKLAIHRIIVTVGLLVLKESGPSVNDDGGDETGSLDVTGYFTRLLPLFAFCAKFGVNFVRFRGKTTEIMQLLH